MWTCRSASPALRWWLATLFQYLQSDDSRLTNADIKDLPAQSSRTFPMLCSMGLCIGQNVLLYMWWGWCAPVAISGEIIWGVVPTVLDWGIEHYGSSPTGTQSLQRLLSWVKMSRSILHSHLTLIHDRFPILHFFWEFRIFAIVSWASALLSLSVPLIHTCQCSHSFPCIHLYQVVSIQGYQRQDANREVVVMASTAVGMDCTQRRYNLFMLFAWWLAYHIWICGLDNLNLGCKD
jgi:hypothetical protein